MSLSSSLLSEAGGEVEGWGGGGDMTSRPGVRVPQLEPGLVSPFRNLNRVLVKAYSKRVVESFETRTVFIHCSWSWSVRGPILIS